MKRVYFIITFFFIPLLAFAQIEDVTINSDSIYMQELPLENKSNGIEENKQLLLIPDAEYVQYYDFSVNNDIDTLLSDINSYSILKEQYDSLYK